MRFVKTALMMAMGAFALSGPSHACPSDTWTIEAIEKVAEYQPVGMEITVKALEVRGKVNDKESFHIYLDDEQALAALATVAFNPYYGVTRHNADDVNTSSYLFTNDEINKSKRAAHHIANFLAQNNPDDLALPTSDELAESAENDAKAYNELAKTFADKLGAFVQEINNRAYVLKSSDKNTVVLSTLPRAISGSLKQKVGGTDVKIQRFDGGIAVYDEKSLPMALFKTAALGSGGTRGGPMFAEKDQGLSQAQQDLVVASRMPSCQMNLNVDKDKDLFGAINWFFEN